MISWLLRGDSGGRGTTVIRVRNKRRALVVLAISTVFGQSRIHSGYQQVYFG